MKVLKAVSLGIVIWSISLMWPEINRGFTEELMTRLVLTLATITSIYVLMQHLEWYHHLHRGSGQNHHSQSLPMIVP